jgi:hypothetical protein
MDFCYFLNLEGITVSSSCPYGAYTQLDCNFNGVNDNIEIRKYPYLDSNSNGIIDECEIDCNSNGAYDYIDIQSGASRDLDDNHVPDECQPDCNNNGIPDELDIIYHTSSDSNRNSIPDECENKVAASPSPSPSTSISPPPTVSVTPSTSPSPLIPYFETPDPNASPTSSPDSDSSPSSTPSITPSPSPYSPSPSPVYIPPSPSPSPVSCGGVVCSNEGTCNEETGRCDCTRNWIGIHCEISDCSFNGIYNMYMESCNCYAGWTGPHCEYCATTLENHLDKVYLCCPAYSESQSYMLVLVPEDRRDDYLNGLYTTRKCEYPNTTFPNKDYLDCSCKLSEGPSTLSEDELELRRSLHEVIGHSHTNKMMSMKNKLGNIIQDYQGVDPSTYNMAMITIVGQMMMEELSQNYPIQLGAAMSNNVVSFSEDSSSDENTAGIIIFTVVMVIVSILGIAMLFVFGVAKNKEAENSFDSEKRLSRKISRRHRV